MDSIEYISKNSKKTCTKPPQVSAFEWPKRGVFRFGRCAPCPKSALSILSSLVTEENLEETEDFVSRKGSLNPLNSSKIVKKLTPGKHSLFKQGCKEHEVSNLQQGSGNRLPEDSFQINKLSNKLQTSKEEPLVYKEEEPSLEFSLGSRSRAGARWKESLTLDKDSEPIQEGSSKQLKFPSLRKDSRATTDTAAQAENSSSFAQKQGQDTIIPDQADCLTSKSRTRKRRAVAVEECETLEANEPTDYKMNLDFKSPAEDKTSPITTTPSKSPQLKLQIKILKPEEECEVSKPPLNKILIGVKNMLREEKKSVLFL